MTEYLKFREKKEFIRLPLKGILDLTYRCNNNCRHCWLKMPTNALEINGELNIDEIKMIVDDARKMGCRHWSISGGEPMLRQDFDEIFDYITKKSTSYSLNTNGTLINLKIASLMKRKGFKMVALYGATAEVHDYISRNPGSFEATMQGIAYLREARVGFHMQLIPMKENYHQFQDMIKLAKSLTPHYRRGTRWLYLTDCNDLKRNKEIIYQRLPPEIVAEMDKRPIFYDESINKEESHRYNHYRRDDRLFHSCISKGCGFHINPYGRITFCCFIKEPSLRYDLRKGSLKECWDVFIPSLAEKIRGGKEYLENCGSCMLRNDCDWCPAYGYLEQRRFSAKVGYLCLIAKESRKLKEELKKKHRRFYQIAGITLQIDTDIPFTDTTFHSKFKPFEVKKPSRDIISIRHHSFIPKLNNQYLENAIYWKAPLVIFRNRNSWIYLEIFPINGDTQLNRVAIFNNNYTKVEVFHPNDDMFFRYRMKHLIFFPIDQTFLAQIIADKKGCYFHSSAVALKDAGLLFLGNSNIGKITSVKILKHEFKILNDDQIIIMRHHEGFRIHRIWSQGNILEILNGSGHLKAILFIEKNEINQIIRLYNNQDIIKRLLVYLIRPIVVNKWWDKMQPLLERIASEVPCYLLSFNKTEKIVGLLKNI